jgi:hypothetical protein
MVAKDVWEIEYRDKKDLEEQLEGAISLLGALILRMGGEVELQDSELEPDYELLHSEGRAGGLLVRARRLV